jgi:hypothetical protein
MNALLMTIGAVVLAGVALFLLAAAGLYAAWKLGLLNDSPQNLD